MIDLTTLKKMVGLEEDFLPAMEQAALWQDVEFLTAKVALPERHEGRRYSASHDGVTVSPQTLRSLLRAYFAAESQLAAARAHFAQEDEDGHVIYQ